MCFPSILKLRCSSPYKLNQKFLLPYTVEDSILIVQGCQSYSILFNARCLHRFHRQGKLTTICFLPVSNSSISCLVSVLYSESSNWWFQTREEKFRRRMKRYVGIWCCVMDHTPGHIYYDMYWDEKPDWKPIPPQKPEDDHPPLWVLSSTHIVKSPLILEEIHRKKYPLKGLLFRPPRGSIRLCTWKRAYP